MEMDTVNIEKLKQTIMTPESRLQLGIQAGKYLDQGYHCSEAVLISAGESLFGEIDPKILKIASALSGGIGSTEQEACGALTGGVLVLGLLFGREGLKQSDTRCLQLTKEWRDHFLAAFGHTQCAALRKQGMQNNGHSPCKGIVVQSVPILLNMIAEDKSRG